MGLSKDLHIGFFETDHAQRAYLQSLLLQAGYTVSPYPQATESLEDVLASIMEASETIPHDLLIIHLPAASSLLPDSLLIALQQLTHEDLPLILLTNTRSQGLRLLHAGLPHTSILPHYPLPLTDLFDTIARLTHQTPSHTSDFFQALLLLQSQQHAFMQERERVWLGQREEWLDQRDEWLDQRDEWLNQRDEWIRIQAQHPHAQREWLGEQQAWIASQREEVKQQRYWALHLRLWLKRYERTFNQQEPPVSEAN